MLKRIANIIKGFFGLFVRGIEKSNPKALLQVEKDGLRDLIGRFNTQLAGVAGNVHKQEADLKKSEKESAALTTKVQTYIKMGNNEMAGQFAAKLQKESARQEQISEAHAELKGNYDQLVKSRDISVKAAKAKIEAMANKIEDIATAKIMAETNELASGLMTNLADNNLGHLEEMLDEELNLAKGRVTVSQNPELLEELAFQEASQEVESASALAAFMATEGMSPKATETSAKAELSNASNESAMGPITR